MKVTEETILIPGRRTKPVFALASHFENMKVVVHISDVLSRTMLLFVPSSLHI